MVCSNCGTEFEGKFCPNCGTTVNPTQENSAQPTPPAGKPKKPIYKRGWFIFLVILAVIIVVICITQNEKSKFAWSDIVMGEVIPEPPVNKGEIYSNSDEALDISVEGVSNKQYSEYVAACEDKGFTEEADKSSDSYEAFSKDGYKLSLDHNDEELSIQLEAPRKMDAISWPSSAIAQAVPVPESTVGSFSCDEENEFSVYVGNTTKEDFDAYVAVCIEAGFTVDYSKGDTYYYADNAAGYHIDLTYEGGNVMSVSASEADDEDDEWDEDDDWYEDDEEETPTKATTSKTDTDSLSPEFKKAMDSYETFVDEYVAFMKKYHANPTDTDLLADYADYLDEYAKMCKDFKKWDSKKLSSAEVAYYADVQARTSKKILEITK